MFYKSGIIFRSTKLDAYSEYGVRHGFSSREGGVSTLPHTKSLNLTKNRGDSDDTVRENTSIFIRAVTDGILDASCAVTASQIHSSIVRVIDESNRGEGSSCPRGDDCDGFCTASPNTVPIVRAADCVPILLAGLSDRNTPVIAAAHAGWRGTVAGIAAEAVSKMISLGAPAESISAAIGPHIGFCCFEVGEDFYESVREIRGNDFAGRHIVKTPRGNGGKFHADLTAMNVEILTDAGVRESAIDISDKCTMCFPDEFFSHRATGGVRGTQGGCIAIVGE